MIIKAARFIGPYSKNSITIQIGCDHNGVADARAPVSCLAHIPTCELREFANVKDGPAGNALIAYLKAASSSGRIGAAIGHARSAGWCSPSPA